MTHTFRSRAHCAIALISAWVYTAPVGLHGEQRMRPRAPGTTRSRSRTLTFRLHSGSPDTSTGRARARYTICGYDTHAGAGMATTSPGPNNVKHTLKSDCFDPFDTTMLSAFTGRPPESSDRCFAAAARSSRIPSFAGECVFPSRIARTPASAGIDGVGKSGSPAPRSITSSPAALRRFASCEMAIVAEVSRCCTLGEKPEAGLMGDRIATAGDGTQPGIPRLKPGLGTTLPLRATPRRAHPSGWGPR